MNRWINSKFIHSLKKRRVSLWQLVVLFIVLLFLSIVALRHNNLQMVARRAAVVEADRAGEGLPEAIEALNGYIFRHMNTQVVRPIELVSTYNRRAQVVIEAAQKGSGRDIYAEGTNACERRGIPLSSIARCIADYANSNTDSVSQQKIVLPEKSLFTYTYAAPLWTPDMAGFLLLLTVVVLLWLVARVVEIVVVRIVVRSRLKNGL